MINEELAMYAQAFAACMGIPFEELNLAYFNAEEYVEVGLE